MEKLQLTSLEAHSNLAAADIPCTCVGAIGSPTEVRTHPLKSLNRKFLISFYCFVIGETFLMLYSTLFLT